MPCATTAGNKLDQFPIPANEKVAGALCVPDLPIVRMSKRVKAIGKQIDDSRTAKITAGQADVVGVQQLDTDATRPTVQLRREVRDRSGPQPASAQIQR